MFEEYVSFEQLQAGLRLGVYQQGQMVIKSAEHAYIHTPGKVQCNKLNAVLLFFQHFEIWAVFRYSVLFHRLKRTSLSLERNIGIEHWTVTLWL